MSGVPLPTSSSLLFSIPFLLPQFLSSPIPFSFQIYGPEWNVVCGDKERNWYHSCPFLVEPSVIPYPRALSSSLVGGEIQNLPLPFTIIKRILTKWKEKEMSSIVWILVRCADLANEFSTLRNLELWQEFKFNSEKIETEIIVFPATKTQALAAKNRCKI